ncbi:MAG: PilZ domain-containing protein [Myxococcota bacterium]
MASKRERRHIRVSVKLRVRIDYDGHEYYFFTRNLSAGGLFLIIQPPLDVGSEIDMVLLTGKGEVPVRGRVVRAEEYGSAFEFVDLSAETQEQIRAVVSELLSSSVVKVQSIARSRMHEPAHTYWRSGGDSVPVRLTKLSEEGAHFEGERLPELYDQVEIVLPAEDRVARTEESTAVCPAQVIDRRRNGFSVVFLERRSDFDGAVLTMLEPPRQSLH